jgi:pimeloyl-ACP methyl ester carboxylesterase
VEVGQNVSLHSVDAEYDDSDLEVEVATLVAEDNVRAEGLYWKKKGTRPKTGIIMAHPANTTVQFYGARPLSRAGFGFLKVKTRYAGHDATLIFEEILLDIAAAYRWLKKTGVEKIILYGHSGGASTMAYYQSQAEKPTFRSTPAGDPPDLTRCDLPAADALIIANAHPGRHKSLTKSLDPSVIDENDPLAVNPKLDMYNKENGPPYDREWLKTYSAAQVERNRRITMWCKQKLKQLDALGHPVVRDLPFFVYRTVADPGYLDVTIEPNDRKPNTTIWGDPYTINYYAPSAHSCRVSSLRSWLSQFSLDDAKCDLVDRIADVQCPTFFLQGTADRDTATVTEAYERCPAKDKEIIYLKGGTHLFKGQGSLLSEAMEQTINWARKKGA